MRLIAPALTTVLAALSLAGCAATSGDISTSGLDPAAERGQAFAARRCAGCHTVGLDDGGAGEGPSFRALAMRYNPLSLQKRFAEISQHGSGAMPPVTFTVSEAEDLIAYFATLESR
ncbi:MAG: c-type cytochrome [Pseudomonadota bacterium]|jgi:mono/diheme cytochrome c family protein